MLEFVKEIVDSVEAREARVGRTETMKSLRQIGLDQFGALLLSMPNPAFPNLSRVLPAMASDEVQRNWTGNYGPDLLSQSVAFIRSMIYNYSEITGRGLGASKILDFGCGYGRLMRVLYGVTDEQNIYGVDPWDASIELCNVAGISENLFLSDYLPTSLPVGDIKFDLIYAFSVFTHLSERALKVALTTLRNYVSPSGVLLVTIRPVEYWQRDPHTDAGEKAELAQRHRATGFAFKPHNRTPIDGDVTYGDTSVTLDWLAREVPQWRITQTDYCNFDPNQRLVFLTPI